MVYSAATVLHTNSDMYLTDLHTPSELNAPANTLCNAPHSDMYLTDLHTPQWAGTQGVCNTVAALYMFMLNTVLTT